MLSSNDKMTGYLEKKSKMRVVCRWKKLWFVLEGRLLLYYKSQLEYLSLSPCRGTVNLGLAASVAPGKSNEIIVSTRSHTVSLRALNRFDYDIWLQALIDAMCLPNNTSHNCCAKPVHHFRYSTGVLEESDKMLKRVQKLEGDVHTHSARISSTLPKEINQSYNHSENGRQNCLNGNSRRVGSENDLENSKVLLIETDTLPENNTSETKCNKTSDNRIEKLSRKFSKIAVSDTSIPGKFRLTAGEGKEKGQLRRSASVENDLVRFSENIYESVKELDIDIKEIIPKKKKYIDRIKRSDSDRIVSREKIVQNNFRSEQHISMCNGSPLMKNIRRKQGFSLTSTSNREKSVENLLNSSERKIENFRNKITRPFAIQDSTMKRLCSKNIKSDTDLSSVKKNNIKHSGSCDTLHGRKKDLDQVMEISDSHRFTEELNKFRAKMLRDEETIKTSVPKNDKPGKAKRSNSLLRRFSRESSKESYDSGVDIGSTPKKRSLSFLKKMWRKKDKRWDGEDESFSINPDPLEEIGGPSSDLEEEENFDSVELINYEIPQPEPPPDYDEVNNSEPDNEPPELPPRRNWVEKRPSSPWHDVPTNNQPVPNDPPPLPVKTRRRQRNPGNLDFLFYDDTMEHDPNGLRFLFHEENFHEANKRNSNGDPGEMLIKISDMDMSPLETFHYFADDNSLIISNTNRRDNVDPDYDVPRPHASLLGTLRNQPTSSDCIQATRFFSKFEDSLDPEPRDHFDHLTMAPDSLECDPWSLSNEPELNVETWAHYGMATTTTSIEPTAGSFSHDSYYQDSLNAMHNNNRDECIMFQKGFLKLYS